MAETNFEPFVACRACPWRADGTFEPWPRDAVRALESFKKAQIIVRAGRPILRASRAPTAFYTLFRGWAFRYVLANGGRQIIDFCLPGDLIGVQGPLVGSVPYFAQALTDVSLCVFEVADYPRMQADAPFLAHTLARIAANEPVAVQRRLASIGRTSAEARVAQLLAELHDRLSSRGMAKDGTYNVPLTLEYMADALGLSHVHVSRMLKVLHQDGLAHFERGELTILNEGALRRRGHLSNDKTEAHKILF